MTKTNLTEEQKMEMVNFVLTSEKLVLVPHNNELMFVMLTKALKDTFRKGSEALENFKFSIDIDLYNEDNESITIPLRITVSNYSCTWVEFPEFLNSYSSSKLYKKVSYRKASEYFPKVNENYCEVFVYEYGKKIDCDYDVITLDSHINVVLDSVIKSYFVTRLK